MSLTLFHLESDQLLMCELMAPLKLWLQMFDQFNGIAPGVDKEDMDDMSWPGSAKYKSHTSQHRRDTEQTCNNDVTLIRKADLENHNKDGGQWIVIGGQVYDIEDFRSASMADAEDITKLLEATASQGKYNGF